MGLGVLGAAKHLNYLNLGPNTTAINAVISWVETKDRIKSMVIKITKRCHPASGNF